MRLPNSAIQSPQKEMIMGSEGIPYRLDSIRSFLVHRFMFEGARKRRRTKEHFDRSRSRRSCPIRGGVGTLYVVENKQSLETLESLNWAVSDTWLTRGILEPKC